MTNFDGIAEGKATKARLADLAGGRMFDRRPADEQIPVYGNGEAMPYIQVSIGTPFVNPAGDKAFGDGQRESEYTLTVVVGCYAGNGDNLDALWAAVCDRMIGWSPNPGNASEYSLPYAYNGSSGKTDSAPELFSRIASFKSTINLKTR